MTTPITTSTGADVPTAADQLLARRARLRILRLVPLDIPAPGTVAAADLHTSMCDARAALRLALGGVPDIDGYPT